MVTSDPYKLQLQFLVDGHEVMSMMEMYQPVLNWVDSDLRLFRIKEKSDYGNCNQSFCQPKRVSRMPSVAIMIFLNEEGPIGYERVQSAKRRFEKPPWKFHHSEQVGQGKINPYPYNSPDYFYTSEELPLWAVRLVHCGKEFIRIVLFTSDVCWDDMIQFYKLIIGYEPDINKSDFCMFTVHSRDHYDVQFALKKLKGETNPRPLDAVKLQFSVSDVGSLVPLFPNVCKPVSDGVWETQDHDGNMITIDVIGKPNPQTSTPSDIRNLTSASDRSRKSSRSSRSSAHSSKSVQSFTSVTSSSSTTSSFTSLSSDISEKSDIIARDKEEDIPPKLPPRVPLKGRRAPPKLPEKPKQCLATLQGFYV
ncbi:protein FAM124A-like isoform X2 [Ruditapes philippinarum]|nr:protein FAM124A-like isoform X2 [Ruditapes philippinarum]